VNNIEPLEQQTIVIPAELAGQRLDYALTCLCELTRSRIKELLKQQQIISNQQPQPLKPSYQVSMNETFILTLPATQAMQLIPENIPLSILYEDEFLVVVNKPAGMVVHPSHGHNTGTLVHALLHHCPSLPGINGVERPGIVHRLDKDTSGSLVVAKTEAAHHGLVALFAEHDIDRQYLAWCKGVPNWRHKHIEQPMARHPQHRQKMAIVAGGKKAITDADVEQCFDKHFSRMRLTLHTGRTHQIRVHLSHENLPILADSTYARNFNPNKSIPEDVCLALQHLTRQALHAEILGFIHPITKESIYCQAPLPDDLMTLNQSLIHSYAKA